MWGVLAGGAAAGALVVVAQAGAVVGVGAALDHQFGALLGAQAAQVGQALLGDDDLHVVLGVVHMADHRHDAADAAALGGAGGHEHAQVGVAGEVARAADAVHDGAAHHVGGVDVAVQVGLDHAVHRDDAPAADQLGVVADLLGAQQDAAVPAAQVGV